MEGHDRIKVSVDALRDLNDGFVFDEAQQSRLGDYFVTCLRADIEGLRIYGGIHRVVYQDYHRLLSKVFPYGVLYPMGGDCAAGAHSLPHMDVGRRDIFIEDSTVWSIRDRRGGRFDGEHVAAGVHCPGNR